MDIVKKYKQQVKQSALGFEEIQIEPTSYSYYYPYHTDKKTGKKIWEPKIPRIRTFRHIYVDTSNMNDLRKALQNIPLKANLTVWKKGNKFYWQYGRRPIVIIKGSKNPKFYTLRMYIDKRFKEAKKPSPRKYCNTQAQICLTMLKRIGFASCKWCG